MAIQLKRTGTTPTAEQLSSLADGQPLVNLETGDLYVGGCDKKIGQELVEAEATARESNDAELQQNIEDEMNARQAFDNTHNNIENGEGVGSIKTPEFSFQVEDEGVVEIKTVKSAIVSGPGSVSYGGGDHNGYTYEPDENALYPDASGLYPNEETTMPETSKVTGVLSSSFGSRNFITGDLSLANGLFNIISLNRSFASGYNNQVSKSDSAAIGDTNMVAGGNSVALAYHNKVYADASVALGHSNIIGTKGQTGNAAQSSVAAGEGNTLTGAASFAANCGNTVSGYCATAFGFNNTATAAHTFIAGQENESTNQRNFIYGWKNKSSKSDSILLGTGLISDTAEKVIIVGNYNSNDNIVQGETLFAIGGGSSDLARNNAFVVNRSNIYATAKFNFNNATGVTVAAESLSIGTEKNSAGETVTAAPLSKTYHSIRVGENNTLEAYKSGVFGVGNSLTNGIENSFMFGGYNTGVKSYSFIAGRGLQDNFRSEWWYPKFTIGRYNLDAEDIKDSILVIGNGTNDSNRSNALRVTSEGDVIVGKSTDSNSEDKALTTKDYVIERVADYAKGIASSLLLANSSTKQMIEGSGTLIKTATRTNAGDQSFYYSDLWITCNGSYGSSYKMKMVTKNASGTITDTQTLYEGSGFNHCVFEMWYPQGQEAITFSPRLSISTKVGTVIHASKDLSGTNEKIEVYIEGTCAYLYKEDGYDYYKF